MSKPLVEERTIMKKRPCKHCSVEIYLQYIPVTPSIKWVSFNAADGRLHSCTNKPLDFQTRKLVQETVNRMKYTNNTDIIYRIDMAIQNLQFVRERLSS